ncbi:MAG: aldehyde:ferredoxin oxidoreductase [Candidatus Latescibacteria bacterium]|nr:aldehyde:ferredoxin oxidoreductase [Candidatus Latescibacterota bacterium]NIO28383.1 aldehyde:ferredoxin oxidoreductase [Candidatus Latescibacterota bacterium]NIO55932.1 aldehyde:ferredoxin oxidoreductase [Candidatus Latescibacterota bacterium]NIT01896.1 aldehyde:ferredoxin oxidoreductase [Candidatus Latescibacterota bacterium]
MRSRTALVDLPEGRVQYEDTPPDVVRNYLGGRGINMAYLHKMLPAGIDPLSPDNILIIGTGALTGTGCPNSSRFNVTAKSPESNLLGDANCGGFFAPKLRYSGIDRLIIKGKAKNPVFVRVENGEVTVEDAKNYWGMDVNEVQASLRRDIGPSSESICIGPAGENLVRFACIMTGVKNAAGRGGMGAVMGSKNIKAIAAAGGSGFEIADPDGLLELNAQLKDYLTDSMIVKVLGRVGTPLLYEVSNHLGTIRTRNSQDSAFEDTLNAEVIHKHVAKMIACHSCVVHCRHRNIYDGEGPEYTTIGLLGANLGIADTANVIRLNNLVNRLGLDCASTGGILSWAIELYQRGIIDDSITGGPIQYDDYDLAVRLIEATARREGFGDILADSSQAAEKLNDPERKYITAIKGLPQSDPHDCRYIKAFALGIATASRGADHLRSRPTLEVFDLPQELLLEIYGADVNRDPTSYLTKEIVVATHENIYAITDSVGICKFICHGFNSPKLLKYEHFSRLLEKAFGATFSVEDLKDTGRRIVDLERAIINREGVRRPDDTLPNRYFEDPLPHGVAKGHRIEKDKFLEMLDKYYQLRHWDEEGVVPKERIAELVAPWDGQGGGVQ